MHHGWFQQKNERMKPTLSSHPKAQALLPWPIGLLLILCILPEVIFQLADHGVIGPPYLRSLTYAYGAFQPGMIATHGQLYPVQALAMFVTYGFLHTGLFHLIVNMIGLVWLGRMVLEQRIAETFLTFYLLSTIGAVEVFALIGPKGGTVVGASGALFGLLGIYVADNGLLLHNAANHRFWPQISRVFLMTLAVILSDVVSRIVLGMPVAWEAHAGGFLTGALVAMAAPPRKLLLTE